MPSTILQHRRALAKIAGSITSECAAQNLECPVLSDADIARMDARGLELMNAKQLDEAELVFLAAYAFSGKPWPLLRVAAFEYLQKDYKAAIEHAEKARRGLKGTSPKKVKEAEALVKAIKQECAADKTACR
jgi:hypothetical protein